MDKHDVAQSKSRGKSSVSTGPRTQSGKAKSSRNAVTNGFWTTSLIVHPGLEKKEDFDQLLSQLFEEHAPAGALEEACVLSIAYCIWRLRRLPRAEWAVCAEQLLRAEGRDAERRQQAWLDMRDLRDMAPLLEKLALRDREEVEEEEEELDEAKRREAQRAKERQEEEEEKYVLDASRLQARLQSTAAGLREMLMLLSDIRRSMREDDDWHTPFLNASFSIGTNSPAALEMRTAGVSFEERASMPEPVDPTAECAESLTKLIAELEEATEKLRKREDRELAALREQALVPAGQELDQFVRFESHVSRELRRSVDQLHDLQAQRGMRAALSEGSPSEQNGQLLRAPKRRPPQKASS